MWGKGACIGHAWGVRMAYAGRARGPRAWSVQGAGMSPAGSGGEVGKMITEDGREGEDYFFILRSFIH